MLQSLKNLYIEDLDEEIINIDDFINPLQIFELRIEQNANINFLTKFLNLRILELNYIKDTLEFE